MDQNFDLQSYMTRGVERVVSDALKATVKNPRESAFMLRFAAASRAASARRAEAEKNGMHIPPFLIASITSKCNLHCAGCYSRCNHATVDSEPVAQLSSEEWLRIFSEADDLGISFILLAGGEPCLLPCDPVTCLPTIIRADASCIKSAIRCRRCWSEDGKDAVYYEE